MPGSRLRIDRGVTGVQRPVNRLGATALKTSQRQPAGPGPAASAGKQTGPSAFRTLSWAGISFDVPANWDLGLYNFLKRGVRRVEVEDEYAVRLEAEWIFPRKAVKTARVVRRYEEAAGRMTRKADSHVVLDGLPAGWTATLYRFSETFTPRRSGGLKVVRHALVTAFYLAPDSSLFAFFMLHFLPEDREDPAQLMRQVAGSFRNHARSALIPWQLLDVGFEMPAEFLLEFTHFGLGANLMAFRRRLRRLYLWHFSCADRFLKPDEDPREWFARYVNDSRVLRGGSFLVDPGGNVCWRRKRRHFIGHRDEISRWCFRYKLACRIDRSRNRLIGWAYSYRSEADLEFLPDSLRFDLPA